MIEPLLWILGIGLVGWFALESACRLWLARRGRYYSWTPNTRIRLTLQEDVFPKLDRSTRFDVNSIGERGAEPPSAGESAWHVVAMGGSAVECYMNDQETQWPHRIQVELNRPEALATLGVRRVHVGNIGRSLMACGPLCTMLEKVLDNYERLDQLVMMVGSSDVVAWTEMGAPATFEPKTLDAHTIYRAHPLGPFTWHPVRSAFRRIFSATLRNRFKPVKRYQSVGNTVRRNRERRQSGEMVDQLPDPSAMLALYRQNLARLIELASLKADRVLVILTPWLDREVSAEESRWFWNFGLGKPQGDSKQRYLSYAATRELLGEMDRVTREVAQELDVPQVEIRSHLDLDFDTFYDELHLTPKGCEAMGALVAQAILHNVRAEARQTGGPETEAVRSAAHLRAQA
ncbi:MAG: hypothetical protein H6830_08920 [Planctomycetes bacterium]|nr:hypothetical protein [Planctomycetota bacterium]MCB9909604.1 hypothetical protein [Planctomycetota bacterium]MCB9911907.1 hypothetical protein [Planctomycetota bacterium]HPF14046.1 hypothetical protein [Planctomycetota bacterium]HRV79998.1 hypothetical protein [Planctomycetota bacterium]